MFLWNHVIIDNSNNILSQHIIDESGNKLSSNKYKLTINDLDVVIIQKILYIDFMYQMIYLVMMNVKKNSFFDR